MLQIAAPRSLPGKPEAMALARQETGNRDNCFALRRIRQPLLDPRPFLKNPTLYRYPSVAIILRRSWQRPPRPKKSGAVFRRSGCSEQQGGADTWTHRTESVEET